MKATRVFQITNLGKRRLAKGRGRTLRLSLIAARNYAAFVVAAQTIGSTCLEAVASARAMRLCRSLVSCLLVFISAVFGASRADDVIVSPTDCGVDAQPCIQRAVEKAASTKGSVILMPGQYTLAESIKLRSGVSILGSSLAVLKPAQWTNSSALLLHGHQVHDISIEGVVLDGGGQDFPSEAAMVILNSTRNVVLRGVTMQHSRGSAIVVYADTLLPSINNGVEFSRIADVGNHWRTTKLPSGRVQAVVFYDEKPYASEGNFARNNYFTDTGLDAIQLQGQRDFMAERNFFDLANEQPTSLKVGDFPAALFIETSFAVTVRDNYIRGAMGNCVDMPGVEGAFIVNNYITQCGQSGIGIFRDYDTFKQNSSDIQINDNVITNSAIWKESWWKAGITIANGTPNKISISGNIITDMRLKGRKTQDYGIEIVNDHENDIRTAVTGLYVAPTNRLDGNQKGRTKF